MHISVWMHKPQQTPPDRVMTETGKQQLWHRAHSRSAGEVLAAVTQCTLGAIPVYVQFVTSNALSLTMVSMPTVCKHMDKHEMSTTSAHNLPASTRAEIHRRSGSRGSQIAEKTL